MNLNTAMRQGHPSAERRHAESSGRDPGAFGILTAYSSAHATAWGIVSGKKRYLWVDIKEGESNLCKYEKFLNLSHYDVIIMFFMI